MFRSIIASFILCWGLGIYGYAAPKVEEGKYYIEGDTTIVCISFPDERIVHVQVYPKGNVGARRSLVVDESRFDFNRWRVLKNKQSIVLRTNVLQVEYDRVTGTLTFIDRQRGEKILSEVSRSFAPEEMAGDKAWQVRQEFLLTPEEAIYGLGQFQEGVFNYRGHQANLVHANREIANPVLLSSRNYLLYWDNYSKTLFEEKEGKASLYSEMGDGIDYYLVYGKDMNDAIVGFRHLTGKVPMFPKSAFGFWMSKERYRSFDELTAVVAEYRKRRIPLDNIVQDWQYWGEDMSMWNSMTFDSLRYADPKKRIDSLHQVYHVKLTVSVWPGVGKKTAVYQAMDSAGVLFQVPTWADYKVVDIYNPVAQDIFWQHLYAGLYTKGVDSWWMDATEPSFRDGLYQSKQEYWTKKAGKTAIGSFGRYLNTYSLVLSGMLYEQLRQQSNRRVSILTRSAFAGQQKYAASTWSGDIYASWEVFKNQIPAGLNLCMTGIPYWTTDIGGFRVISQEKGGNSGKGEIGNFVGEKAQEGGGYRKGLRDSAYLELYTRWFQFGAFCPMFRAHGTEVPREIWHFGEPGSLWYDAQVEMINLRYSLLSYIYSMAWKVTAEHATMMRALVMDFPEDQKTHDDAGSYMFGDALLVHPVTHPMFYERNGKVENPDTRVAVYLPQCDGNYWFDFNTNRCFAAGNTIQYEAPLKVVPVFVKAGSIIPRNTPAQYASEGTNEVMDIVVYAGEDAGFTLYEDDNETYGYEKGEYAAVDIHWNEKQKKLSVSKLKGAWMPATEQRVFRVKVLWPQADGRVITKEKQVAYQGQSLVISFE